MPCATIHPEFMEKTDMPKFLSTTITLHDVTAAELAMLLPVLQKVQSARIEAGEPTGTLVGEAERLAASHQAAHAANGVVKEPEKKAEPTEKKEAKAKPENKKAAEEDEPPRKRAAASDEEDPKPKKAKLKVPSEVAEGNPSNALKWLYKQGYTNTDDLFEAAERITDQVDSLQDLDDKTLRTKCSSIVTQLSD